MCTQLAVVDRVYTTRAVLRSVLSRLPQELLIVVDELLWDWSWTEALAGGRGVVALLDENPVPVSLEATLVYGWSATPLSGPLGRLDASDVRWPMLEAIRPTKLGVTHL